MNKNKWETIILVLFYIFLINCNNSDSKSELKIELLVYDSIKLKSSSLGITDIKYSKLLLYDYFSYEIVTYDLNTKEETRFNNYGEGPDNYGYINWDYLRFYNDSTIIVIRENNLQFYSIKGALLKQIKLGSIGDNFNKFVKPIRINDSLLLLNNVMLGGTNLKEYYLEKRFLYTIVNLHDTTKKELIQYPPKGSIQANGVYYFEYGSSYHGVLKADSVLCFLSFNEPKVFSYNLLTQTIQDTFTLNLKNYNPYIRFFNKEYSAVEYKKAHIQNSYIYSFSIINDTMLIAYKKGYTDSEFESELQNVQDINAIPFASYLHLQEKNADSFSELLVPDSIGIFAGAMALDKLYFQRKNTMLDEEHNVKCILVAKVSIMKQN